MQRKLSIGLAFFAGITLIAATLWAGDFSRYSTEELMRMQGGIHSMNPKERQSFREEMDSRYRSMSPDQRRRYQGYMHDYGNHSGWNGHRDGIDHDRNGHVMDDGFRNDMGRGAGGGLRHFGYGSGGGG